MNPSPLDLTNGEWQNLVRKVCDGTCTPFLGVGAAKRIFGDTAAIARSLVIDEENKIDDSDLLDTTGDNLPRLSQQLQTRYSEDDLRERWAKFIDRKAPKNLILPPDLPQMALAGLNFPVWITTAYDDLILRALAKRAYAPEPRLCRWSEFGPYDDQIEVPDFMENRSGRPITQPFADYHPPDNTAPEYEGKKSPLVYHLYGHYSWKETLVTSQVHFLELLAKTAEAKDRQGADLGRIPERVLAAIRTTSLLFIGYRLGDLDFRILLHTLKDRFVENRGFNIAIQVEPKDPTSAALQQAVGEGEQRRTLRDYAQREIKQYFPWANIRVVFAEAEKFAGALSQDGDKR